MLEKLQPVLNLAVYIALWFKYTFGLSNAAASVLTGISIILTLLLAIYLWRKAAAKLFKLRVWVEFLLIFGELPQSEPQLKKQQLRLGVNKELRRLAEIYDKSHTQIAELRKNVSLDKLTYTEGAGAQIRKTEKQDWANLRRFRRARFIASELGFKTLKIMNDYTDNNLDIVNQLTEAL